MREVLPLEGLAEQAGVGEMSLPPPVAWVRADLLCQRWTNGFMKNPACDFSV